MIQFPSVQFVLLNGGGSCRLPTALPPPPPPSLHRSLSPRALGRTASLLRLFRFDVSEARVECRLCFQTFAERESLLPYQLRPLCCLTAHSFPRRASRACLVGVARTSLDGSSVFTVSSPPMCASSQKRGAAILLSRCPSGSADLSGIFLKGRVFLSTV